MGYINYGLTIILTALATKYFVDKTNQFKSNLVSSPFMITLALTRFLLGNKQRDNSKRIGGDNEQDEGKSSSYLTEQLISFILDSEGGREREREIEREREGEVEISANKLQLIDEKEKLRNEFEDRLRNSLKTNQEKSHKNREGLGLVSSSVIASILMASKVKDFILGGNSIIYESEANSRYKRPKKEYRPLDY